MLDEIAELVSDTGSVEQEVDRKELVKAIDAFLDRLPTDKRSIFICRYWYFDSVSKDCGPVWNDREPCIRNAESPSCKIA